MACSMVFRGKYDRGIFLFTLPNGSSFDGLCDVVHSKFTNLAQDAFEINTPAEFAIFISDVDPEFNPFINVNIVDNLQGKLGKHCIAMGFEVKFKKNHLTRVTAVCSKSEFEGCGWLVHVVLRGSDGSFVIKKLVNEHICIGRLMGRKSKMTCSKVVASVIANKVEFEPSLSAKDVVKSMQKECRITISYWNAWDTMEIAWREVHGDDEKLYNDLVHYIEILQWTNLGTRCSLKVEPDTSRFCRILIAIRGYINRFLRCRPILFVDATFLKNKFKNTLMADTTINEERGLLLSFRIFIKAFVMQFIRQFLRGRIGTNNGNDDVVGKPPLMNKQAGRPRNSRFKSKGEESQGKMICSRCGLEVGKA
ncbi:hypothetical protein LguiB_027190 [Lonicera macranthoides]